MKTMQRDEAKLGGNRPTHIHPTAIVEDGAKVGPGAVIGAYAYVGPEVTLRAGCHLHHHATIEGATEVGPDCEVFPYACLGLKSQDLKFCGGRPRLRVGKNNVFREFCTVHAATYDGEFTTVGDHSYFLAYTHVAHDCQVGSHVIMSNNATLGGHVWVEDHVIVGGMTGVHQFCRLGARAMIGGCSKVEKDIPPFLIGDGQPALVRGFNIIGLQRAGFTEEAIARVKFAYKVFYRDGLNRAQALAKLGEHAQADSPEIVSFIEFAARSERGFAPGPRRGDDDETV